MAAMIGFALLVGAWACRSGGQPASQPHFVCARPTGGDHRSDVADAVHAVPWIQGGEAQDLWQFVLMIGLGKGGSSICGFLIKAIRSR